MEYRKVFPIQDEVVYANGMVPYIPEESLDYSKALLRVEFNSFKTFTDSNFSSSILSLGLKAIPKFIVMESHLEGPYDASPDIPELWKSIGRNSSVLTHLAPLDMKELDYIPIMRSQISIYTDGLKWLGFESKGCKLIKYVDKGMQEMLRFETNLLEDNNDGLFSFDFINQNNDAVGNLNIRQQEISKIEIDVLGIGTSTGNDIIKQYLMLVSNFNNNRLSNDITMRGKFSKGFAFRPNMRGRTIDDLAKDQDFLLPS